MPEPEGVSKRGTTGPAPSIQGLNAYVQGFVPVQYPVSVPQPAVPQQVPQYVQSNMVPIQQTRLPTIPVSQAGTRHDTHCPSSTATFKLVGVVPRGQGTTQNDVIEHDTERPMETEIDNTSANNLSQYPVADPSCETGVVEPSSSKSESIGANSSSSVHQVELQLR